MQVPYRVRLFRAFEASLIVLALLGQGAFLFSLVGTAAGVDLTPGLSLVAPARLA